MQLAQLCCSVSQASSGEFLPSGVAHTAAATTAEIMIPNVPSTLATRFLLNTETGFIDNSYVASE